VALEPADRVWEAFWTGLGAGGAGGGLGLGLEVKSMTGKLARGVIGVTGETASATVVAVSVEAVVLMESERAENTEVLTRAEDEVPFVRMESVGLVALGGDGGKSISFSGEISAETDTVGTDAGRELS
jgi:hypothetical protein